MHLDTHLSDAELHDLLLGKLPDAAEDAAESHLAECPACQARAAAARSCDTFVQLVTAAGTRVAAARAAAATPQPESPTDAAATQVYSGPPIVLVLVGAPGGLAGHSRYKLVRRLGAGGMGDVWLAEHAVMGRPVALKVIRPEFLSRPGAVERFRREVRAVAALHHPNIVTAFDADEADGTHFLVMEYVPGEALAEVVRRGPLPIADACRAVRDAARGLAHAHAAGLVHRDIKPANLIRATDGTTKVLDFGLVGAGAEAATATGLTGANMVMGTPDYIAPEQATDARSADARSDVYSLGCTLYHLLAGRVPFPGDSALHKLDAHRNPHRNPDPVAGISPKLARVLGRMTAKDPAARYQTAEAVADALDRFCVTLDEDAPTVAASAPTQPRSRRRFAVAAGVLFTLIAVAAGGVVYKVQRDNEVITITTDDPDIEVAMRRNGELVRITDTKTKQTWELDTKKMRLKPDGGELSIDLPGKEPLVIRRNGDVALTIKREPKDGEKPAIPPAADAPILTELKPSEVRIFRAPAPQSGLAISADGRFVFTGDEVRGSALVRCWDLQTGKQVRTFAGHTDVLCDVALSPDGTQLLTGSDDTTARLWDVTTGKELKQFATGRWVLRVAFTRDGKQAITTTNMIRVWDLATGKDQERFPGYVVVGGGGNDNIQALSVSPDGTKIANGDHYGKVRTWELGSGKLAKDCAGHTSGSMVFRVVYSPDGKKLVSAGTDGTARVWDVASGDQLHRLQHKKALYALAFSPGGRFICTAGLDQIIRIWNSTTGEELDRFPGHEAAIGSVAFTPDGKHLLSVSADATMRMWRLPEKFVDPKQK